MRANQQCPKCACRKLFVVDRVTLRDQASTNGTLFTVMDAWVPTGQTGFLSSSKQHLEAGTIEAWVCTRCGFIEWYAKGANELLSQMTRFPETGVRFVDGDVPVPPYR